MKSWKNWGPLQFYNNCFLGVFHFRGSSLNSRFLPWRFRRQIRLQQSSSWSLDLSCAGGTTTHYWKYAVGKFETACSWDSESFRQTFSKCFAVMLFPIISSCKAKHMRLKIASFRIFAIQYQQNFYTNIGKHVCRPDNGRWQILNVIFGTPKSQSRHSSGVFDLLENLKVNVKKK